MTEENHSRFLPSKKFIKIFGAGACLILVIAISSSYFGTSGKFNRNANGITLAPNATVGDLISQDSNSNGIPDWEESLWGLDPKGDGLVNKKIITDKKIKNGLINQDEKPKSEEQLTETDRFAREFLATIIALQQSGNLTQEAVANMTVSLGQNIDAKRAQVTLFTDKNVQTMAENAKNKKEFAINLAKVIKNHENDGFGSEFTIINDGFSNPDAPGSLQALIPVGDAYIDFANELIQLRVPSPAVDELVAVANAALQMGTAIKNTASIYSDAMSGMVGVDEYVQSRDAFDQASASLAQYIAPNIE